MPGYYESFAFREVRPFGVQLFAQSTQTFIFIGHLFLQDAQPFDRLLDRRSAFLVDPLSFLGVGLLSGNLFSDSLGMEELFMPFAGVLFQAVSFGTQASRLGLQLFLTMLELCPQGREHHLLAFDLRCPFIETALALIELPPLLGLPLFLRHICSSRASTWNI